MKGTATPFEYDNEPLEPWSRTVFKKRVRQRDRARDAFVVGASVAGGASLCSLALSEIHRRKLVTISLSRAAAATTVLLRTAGAASALAFGSFFVHRFRAQQAESARGTK